MYVYLDQAGAVLCREEEGPGGGQQQQHGQPGQDCELPARGPADPRQAPGQAQAQARQARPQRLHHHADAAPAQHRVDSANQYNVECTVYPGNISLCNLLM